MSTRTDDDPARASAWADCIRSRERATFAVITLLICVLVPVWSAFDFYLEPAIAREFLVLRLADVAITLALWILISRAGDRTSRRAMLGSVVAVGVMIAFMLPQVEHYLLYVLGFSLVFWGCGLILLWPTAYLVVAYALILSTHLVFHLAWGTHVSERDFFGSLFYLASVSVIATAQLVVRRRLEQQTFRATFALERRNAELAETIAALTASKAQLAASETAVRLREDFISIATHELRSPLGAQVLTLENLLAKTPSQDANRPMLTKLERQVAQLTEQVNGLLDISRLAAGKLVFDEEDVDLVELVREVAGKFEDTAQRAGMRIRLDVPGSLHGQWDRARLEQVISNLISNGIKYGGGQPIDVALERAADRARLSVTDRGIGVAESDQARIFDRFERVAPSRRIGGFGVGLWLARTIVESMGGSIRVASEVGRGSTFSVEVPITPLS